MPLVELAMNPLANATVPACLVAVAANDTLTIPMDI
jgi:hypothetical protein